MSIKNEDTTVDNLKPSAEAETPIEDQHDDNDEALHSDTHTDDKKDSKPRRKKDLGSVLHDMREENKEYRLKYQDALKKLEDTEKKANKSLTEVEKLTKSYSQRIINAELKTAALEAGIIDLDDVRLADLSQVKLLDNQDVQGAREVIEALKTKKPHLFKSSSTSLTDGSPSPASSKENLDEIPEDDFKKRFGIK